ncbi:Ig-like domain-containing protein [Cryomorphaceae bacterium]|nr:Ig-like domain-containing protein [Cryomorphaceae bacterium]
MKRVLIYIVAIFTFSCAQPGSPSGGPKDLDPPEAFEAQPPLGSVQFSAKKITVPFNEYIQLNGLNQQLLISPPMKEQPDIYLKKKSLVIEFQEDLRSNTTYTLNFGESIVDLTEGNPTNFKYVFSTGTFIDSLVFQGEVKNAYTGKPVEGALVMLYGGLDTVSIPRDSLPVLRRPDYATRTDAAGLFTLDYLRHDTYKLFTLVDGNRNYLYDLPNEEIAYLPETISPSDSGRITLRSFVPSDRPAFLKARQKTAISIEFYTVGGERPTVTPLPINPLDTFFTVPLRPDTLLGFLRPDHGYDSLLFAVQLDTVIDTAKITWKERELPETPWKLLPSTGTWNTFDTLTVYNSLPINYFNPEVIEMTADSIEQELTWAQTDAFRYQAYVERAYGTVYQVEVLPNAAGTVRDSIQDTLTATLTYPRVDELGILIVQWTTSSSHPYILDLLSEKNELLARRTHPAVEAETKEISTFRDLPPGQFRLRMIEDRNQNGRWDPGDYWTQVFSERVFYSETTLEVRANWELEYELNLKLEE